MNAMDEDVIDQLAGIAPGTTLDAVRRQRSDARTHAQASFTALFAPLDPAGFSLTERWAVAAFVAALHGQAETAAFYAAHLAESDPKGTLAAAVIAEAAQAVAQGPFGRYPPGPLSAEDTAGTVHRIAADRRAVLGPRLAAALEHVHMLVYHPRDAAPPWLQALVDAGWTTPQIVTLSQLVAFLSFQIRVVLGLRAMQTPTATTA